MDNEFTIEESIQLALLAQDCVIETLSEDPSSEPEPFFSEQRKQLATLLEQVRSGAIHPERAEVQLRAILDRDDKWLEDNQIPSD